MAKKEALKGLIKEKQGNLSAILDQQAENVRQYKALWEERNTCLADGHTLKAHELEGKYYHLRDVSGSQLDEKRIEIDKNIEELQAEAYRLKKGLQMTNEEFKKLKADLWSAADQLRANSGLKSTEYATPILGLIFLSFAESKYSQYEVEINAS
ncbi:type I restriction-modification system subunit M N-terminal domain-containing protein [Paenibacillus polymyxa]|uniref:type I restriction-modification system subunit M N-terminal domain-containing protein n=1 Tax=Paenibacillus polymyxa TaxID=1406 RepID=UPI003217893F